MFEQTQQLRIAMREVVRQYELLHNTFASIASISQWHLLVELENHTILTVQQLATLLNINKSAITRHIQNLILQDLCQVENNPMDRRNKLISLTKKGTIAVKKIHHALNTEIKQAIDAMQNDEINQTIKALNVYAKALRNSRSKKKTLNK